MSKYIDADRLRVEIDKRYAEYRAKMKTDDFTYYEGMADALDLFEQFIDSLQQEQPEINIPSAGSGAMGTTPPKFKLDVKEQPVEGLEGNVFKKWGTTEAEYLSKSMDKVHLEMEIAVYLQDWEDDEEIGLHLSTDYGDIQIELDDIRDLARHFAEWGAEHLKK